jgi:glucokinase
VLDRGPGAVVKGIAGCVKEAAKVGGLSLDDIEGVGVGSPGPLDPFEGVIISPENLPCLHGVRLKDDLKALLNRPIVVDNDANLAALGEQWLGAGKGVDHFLCVTLGTGVGGGWVSDGKLMHGFNGNAAEIGHMSLNYDGPVCLCGSRGCLERYASATAMVLRSQEKMQAEKPETVLKSEGLTTRAIYEAAEAGDAFAQSMFEETGFFLGMGLVNLVSVLNINCIALAGGLALAEDRILEPTRRTYMARGTVGVKEQVSIVLATLGDDAGILGAARLAQRVS